jgi:hypothetical protein
MLKPRTTRVKKDAVEDRRGTILVAPLVPVIEDFPDELEGVTLTGCAIGVTGAYDTPLAFAATWNTDPPPY